MDRKKLDKNVVLTGFTSFFTDVSSEMVYPVLQAFVAIILAAKKAILGPVLGVIEGIAESTASLLKVVAGYYSDKMENRKMPTIVGYGTSALAKLLMFLSGIGWYFVLFARFFDRVGKGVRTAPRDALISESMPKNAQGRAFGFQRGMDFAGATLGSLACYFIVLKYMDPITKTLKDVKSFYILFLISVIPAFLGVIFLFFVREKKSDDAANKKEKPKPNLRFRKFDRNLQVFFISQLLFTLGNSSNQFLLLRSQNLGWSLPNVILMYISLNLISTLLSSRFGKLSDRIGRKGLLVAGYALYAAVYIAFGFITPGANYLLWAFWPVYGLYYAMTEGVEKAFVSDIAPAGSKATALGFYHTIVGVALLPASIVAGLLMTLSPAAPFLFGGGMAVIAVAVLALGVKPLKTQE